MQRFLKSRLGITTVTIVCIVILVIIQRIGFLRPVENVFTTVLSPVQSFFMTAAQNTKELAGYFQNLSDLRVENEDLQQRIATLTEENLTLRNSLQDADAVSEQLTFIESTNFRTVSAKIIGSTADEYLQTVILNKGDSDGIRVGSPVMTANGILIGTVVDTNSAVAKVLLLTDNQSEVSSIVQNDTRSPGIVVGQFGLSLHMQLIPQNETIRDGETVVTSGLEEKIPADLIIGTINEIEKREGELFQEATITPLIDYETVRIVSVILPFND